MFCENCGKKIPDNSVFCEECGARVEPDVSLSVQDNTPVPPPPATPVYNQQQQAPGYAPQPTGYYDNLTKQQPYPVKKTHVGLIIGLAAAVVVIGVGGFFGIRALIGNDDPAPEADAPPSVSDSLFSSEISEQPTTPEPQTLDPNSDNDVTTDIPEEPTTPDPQPLNLYEDYRGYASGNDISIGDFFWFTEDVKWDGLPAGRTAITDFASISGYWKAYTETIPMSEWDGEYLQWFNAEISGDANQAVFTYHTKGFTAADMETGRIDDISPMDGERYNGRFSDGRLFVGDIDTKGVEININDFYTLNGIQYAVGEAIYISNEKEYIVLVRP
jgi:hypothetical protein